MKPAILQDSGAGLWILVVPAEQARSFDQQFAVIGQLQLNAGQRLPYTARTGVVDRIQNRNAAFRQSITLDERHPDRFVETRQVTAERRRTGYRNAQPAA